MRGPWEQSIHPDQRGEGGGWEPGGGGGLLRITQDRWKHLAGDEVKGQQGHVGRISPDTGKTYGSCRMWPHFEGMCFLCVHSTGSHTPSHLPTLSPADGGLGESSSSLRLTPSHLHDLCRTFVKLFPSPWEQKGFPSPGSIPFSCSCAWGEGRGSYGACCNLETSALLHPLRKFSSQFKFQWFHPPAHHYEPLQMGRCPGKSGITTQVNSPSALCECRRRGWCERPVDHPAPCGCDKPCEC